MHHIFVNFYSVTIIILRTLLDGYGLTSCRLHMVLFSHKKEKKCEENFTV